MCWVDEEDERGDAVEFERRVEVEVEEGFGSVRVYLHEDVFGDS